MVASYLEALEGKWKPTSRIATKKGTASAWRAFGLLLKTASP